MSRRWAIPCALVIAGVTLLTLVSFGGSLADHVWPGSLARVVDTNGDGLNLRGGPGLTYRVIGYVPEGAATYVTGDATFSEPYWWYPVEFQGNRGWLVSRHIRSGSDGGRQSAAADGPGGGRTVQAKVTMYSPKDPGLGGVTRSGTPPRWGVVAVDPQYIPLGARLKIEGFDGTFVAEDTGGDVKGWWVDIYTEDTDQATAFGLQNRTVTILG